MVPTSQSNRTLMAWVTSLAGQILVVSHPREFTGYVCLDQLVFKGEHVIVLLSNTVNSLIETAKRGMEKLVVFQEMYFRNRPPKLRRYCRRIEEAIVNISPEIMERKKRPKAVTDHFQRWMLRQLNHGTKEYGYTFFNKLYKIIKDIHGDEKRHRNLFEQPGHEAGRKMFMKYMKALYSSGADQQSNVQGISGTTLSSVCRTECHGLNYGFAKELMKMDKGEPL
ncbi:MAG: hypothetical protein J3Q66DRAFT_398031 [Benniella sp.]|nr:MAG: hypothetical protein J3Q66DRAFT_398031 [Benniella sp.]